MKKLASVLFALLCTAAGSMAQLETGVGYMYSAPRGAMANHIRSIHHMNLMVGYGLKNAPITLGFELGVGNYGYDESKQLYEFPNNTSMLAPVTVSNNVLNTNLSVRYEVLKNATLTPFAEVRGGLSHYGTRLTIEDPRTAHTTECPLPLENEKLVSDVSWVSGAGAGMRFDVGSLFKGLGKGTLYLDFSASYTRGTILDYMSVNPPPPGTTTGPEGVSSVTMPFASEANPEIVHQYHSGYLYRTPLELVDYRFMVVYRLM